MIEHPIDSQLEKIKKIWDQCVKQRSRFAFYDYLGAVYTFYAELKRCKCAKAVARDIHHHLDRHAKFRKYPIRVILDATCNADPKTKSRWTRTLRYAWLKRDYWSDLDKFFRKNGGPAGCAQKYTDRRPTIKRTWAYRGPMWRPIPLDRLRRITSAARAGPISRG
jgi:hypothetical protein